MIRASARISEPIRAGPKKAARPLTYASGRALARASSGRRQEPRGQSFGRQKQPKPDSVVQRITGTPLPGEPFPFGPPRSTSVSVTADRGASLTEHWPNLANGQGSVAKGVSCRHQLMDGSGLRHGVSGVLDDAQCRLRPCPFEVPGIGHRRANVIAAMDDDARNIGQPVGLLDQLAVALEKAAMNEIMALDRCEGPSRFGTAHR